MPISFSKLSVSTNNLVRQVAIWVIVFWGSVALGFAQNNRCYRPMVKNVRYVILPDSGYLIHKVTAIRQGEEPSSFLAKQGYQRSVDATLEIYNLVLPGKQVNQLLAYTKGLYNSLRDRDTLLVSFAMLPFTDGNIAWEPVRLDTLHGYRYYLRDFIWEARGRLNAYRRAGSPGQPELLYRDDICPIIHRNGQYWVPRPYVMTGYFQVRPRHSRQYSKTDMATINVKGRTFHKQELLKKLSSRIRSLYAFPAGNVLTAVTPTGYDFWLNSSIQYSHPPTLMVYGYNNFRYKPGIGIVSGTFEGYFSESIQVVSNKFFQPITIDGRSVKE